ncbi:SPOR domain-containing protein [Gemmobacter serpentinus]|uniref:SPOR domain-containing protein n=1 Tax=Gemmobacter serpentinus TaxID=2652247 RepID=UPI00124F4C0E|nr:SPOR domain-containing protein [Gemmobacter serpentinus]
MADVNFDRYAGGYAPEARQGQHQRPTRNGGGRRGGAAAQGRRALNLAGAALSLALLLGAGVWGYKIAVRNVLGIPVIKAAEGPMRVAPDNPGGEVTAHQGLSVNDVAAVGVAAPLPEEIVLAPRPVDLADEDVPGLAPEPPAILMAPAAQAPVALPEPDALAQDAGSDPLTSFTPLGEVSAPPAAPDMAQDAAPSDAPGVPGTQASADVLALADSIAAGVAPLSTPPEAVEAAPVVTGGIGKSLRPLARPRNVPATATATDAAVAAALAQTAREVDPAALPAGTRLVQFGAFDSADEARAAWDRISGQFGELMSGKGRVIQEANSGGRTFYRLRAEGFTDEADARRFCAAVSAENTDCIPVALR